MCMLSHFSRVQLFVTLWTVAYQSPLSVMILQARLLSCHALLQGIFPTQGSNPHPCIVTSYRDQTHDLPPCHIIRFMFTVLKILCALPIQHVLLHPNNQWSFYCLWVFSLTKCHIIGIICNLFRLASLSLLGIYGFPGAASGKECCLPMQETWGSIPGSGRSPAEGNGKPLQYSCL